MTRPLPPLRVVALGRFAAGPPPLPPRLTSLGVASVRYATFDKLPEKLDQQDLLLTDLAWLETLPAADRSALAGMAARSSGWIALADAGARFKDQVAWQRAGVTHFFQNPVDPDRLATLIEDIHDQVDGPPIRAILVDDEESALSYYGQALRNAGVVVEATQDPLLVLEVLHGFRPDILVVDIEMPGCRGPELATIVRQRSEFARLPIIFLTAMEGMQDQLLARAAAAEDFLAKPVAPELLVAAVKSQAWRYRSIMRAKSWRRQQELLARRRLEQLRMALDQHAIVSVANGDGMIIDVNDKFCAISGYNRQELLGQNHRLVKSGLHPPGFYSQLWRTLKAGRTWHGEVCNRRKDGQLYWVEATIVPFVDDHGTPTHYISIRTDITARKRSEEALRKSDERLRRSQAFANIGTWDWNIQTGELYWSERIPPLFGYPEGQLETSYENFLKAVHPDDRETVTAAIKASINEDAPYDIEHRVVWPDGAVRWLHERGAVVRDAKGAPLQMLGLVQDITDRIVAEARLRETEERLTFAVEGAGDGIWDWNMVTGEMPLSGHYEAMLGFGKGELSPTIDAWISSVHPDDLARVRRVLDDYLEGRTPTYTIELRLRCKDNGYKWILCRGTIVARDAKGKPVRMIGIHSDISERKVAEERLALFRRIFDASPQCIGITDGQGRLLYQNRAHQEIIGYSDSELLGRPFALLLPADEADVLARQVFASVSNGRNWVGQLPIRRKNGSIFPSSSNVGFLKDADGGIQYLFNIFSDFSEEMARRTELALAKESAERASQAKSNFLSSMSHELRTPMNAIIGFAQMLECDDSLNADQLDNAHEILKAGRHLLELINEVLDLAKIESGRIDLSLEPVELAALIEDCRHLIHPLAASRQITLHVPARLDAVVRADRVRLKQVLLNLLSNAVKYNRQHGHITLRVDDVADNTIRIAVSDTGHGIPADRFAELFQPFCRLDAEDGEVEGTGIGLTITQRLVEMMGGNVGVESEVGVGSTFWIDLAAESPVTATPAAAAATTADAISQRQHRVLCIDDNPVNLKLIAQMLGRRRHVSLVTAHTPELGIELALAHRPELILLDINMPGMNGYQVLEILKADARLKQIPVIAVTANAMPRDIEKGLMAGFQAYLTKPIDLASFLQAVDQALLGQTETLQ